MTTLAQFAEAASGAIIEPWQRDLLDAMKRADVRALVMLPPGKAMAAFPAPELWPKMIGESPAIIIDEIADFRRGMMDEIKKIEVKAEGPPELAPNRASRRRQAALCRKAGR